MWQFKILLFPFVVSVNFAADNVIPFCTEFVNDSEYILASTNLHSVTFRDAVSIE